MSLHSKSALLNPNKLLFTDTEEPAWIDIKLSSVKLQEISPK